MQPKNYRLDIQLLRALAVISVILYHFKFLSLPGGFVGVDVFFVISGYLISGSIIKAQANEKFKFSKFYFNRLKRLYPALLATIIITYAFGFLLFSPIDFESLSASTIYSSLGVSNINFWLTSGYFENFSKLKPLLHTWSLSVEFQFYLVWPIIIIFLAHFKQINIVTITAITLLTGYISYEYLSIDGSGAFYLTPFRIHEFSIGAVIYLLENKFKRKKPADYVLFISGYSLIIYSIIFFDISKIQFPGLHVWIPVIGTALAIYSGKNLDRIQAKSIITRPLIYIGEISYSLYLVHWPIFVFFTYLYIDISLSLNWQLGLILLTYVSALAMYYLIEKPFRNNVRNITSRSYVLICLCITIIIITLAMSSLIGKGWLWRLPQVLQDANNISIEEMHKYTWDNQIKYIDKLDFADTGKEKLLIIGDSQAADLINLLVSSEHYKDFDIIARTIFTECGVPYIEESKKEEYFKKINLYTIQKPDLIKSCEKQMSIFSSDSELALIDKADTIFLSMNWEGFADPYLDTAISQLVSLSKSPNKIWVFGRKTLSKNSIDIFNSYQKGSYVNIDGMERQAAKFKPVSMYKSQEILSQRSDIKFIDMFSFICPDTDRCYVLTDDKKIIFYDEAHLGPDGANFLGNKFYEFIEKNKNHPNRNL